MALEKQTVIDQVEITRDGHVQVRKADLILEDGKEIAKNYHRHVLSPGDDTATEDKLVRDVAALVWTPEVITAYEARQAEIASS